MATCQICEREIKVVKGVISHHGYKRPKIVAGWQTPSCLGARFASYERSRDRLPYVIQLVQKHIDNRKDYHNKLELKEVDIPYSKYAGLNKYETVMIKPTDSINKIPGLLYKQHQGYELSRVDWDIKNSEVDLARLQKRYDMWKSNK